MRHRAHASRASNNEYMPTAWDSTNAVELIIPLGVLHITHNTQHPCIHMSCGCYSVRAARILCVCVFVYALRHLVVYA